MNPAWIVVPVLVHVALVLFLYVQLAVVKARSIRAGEADRKRAALHPDGWPESVMKVNNNITNQFQVPMLFYVLVVMLIMLSAVNEWSMGIACFFVATRIAHSAVHIRSNHVPSRMKFFILGVVAIAALLVVTARAVVVTI